MTRSVEVFTPGDVQQLEPDLQLAADAGAMTARVFVEDMRRGSATSIQAADRMRKGAGLLKPMVAGNAADAFYLSIATAFETAYVCELARLTR